MVEILGRGGLLHIPSQLCIQSHVYSLKSAVVEYSCHENLQMPQVRA